MVTKQVEEHTLNVLKNSTKDLKRQLETMLPALEEFHKIMSSLESADNKDSLVGIISKVEDLLFGSYFILNELMSYLKMSIGTNIVYEKRYFLQCINECICEAYNFLKGKDCDGVWDNIISTVRTLDNPILNVYADNIESELQKLEENFLDIKLRNTTAHYDKPIKMYETISTITSEDTFCKAVSQYMLIHMRITHFTDIIFALLFQLLPTKSAVYCQTGASHNQTWCIKTLLETRLAEKFAGDSRMEIVSKESLERVSKLIDTLYGTHKSVDAAYNYFKEKGIAFPISLRVTHQLCLIRMIIDFMRCDIICAMRAYMNSETNLERAIHLRKIYLTEVSALKHLYGYTEKSRRNSLWTQLMIVNTNYNNDKTQLIQEELDAFESHLDTIKRNLFIHFKEKENLNIEKRYEAYEQLDHINEIKEALALLALCKEMEIYTTEMLYQISKAEDKRHQEQKEKYHDMFNRLRDMMPSSKSTDDANSQVRSMLNDAENKLMALFEL